ncbi:MAG: AAA family ATPase, partial [Planctomycetales bacterium]|nr:AAA family ATPase [Planctomycetales bacterium]
DNYFWLDREETFQLNDPLFVIRDAASAAVEEFDKVVQVRQDNARELQSVQQSVDELIAAIGRATFQSVEEYVQKLAGLREARGRVIGLRELRFIEAEHVDTLESELVEASERLGNRCVQFLLGKKSLEPYRRRIQQAESDLPTVHSTADGKKFEAEAQTIASDLELLIDTVSQLKIEDLTQRTEIVDRTGDLLAALNRVRSSLKAQLRQLLSGEMEAEYASQCKLLDQAVASSLETADTPEKVDEALTRMMLQLEELEGRFAEHDELLLRLTEKRETLCAAFEARRQQLVETRSRRCEALAAAATRISQSVQSRAMRQSEDDALRSYFASDPMVDKVRQIAKQLGALGDTVRMDDVLSRLKSIADDSLRQLHDRKELYTTDGLIQLGRHHFTVNRQQVELTTVVRDEKISLHLTGTQYYEPLHAPEIQAARDLWDQILPSETSTVYRAEFLAAELLWSWDASQKLAFQNAVP